MRHRLIISICFLTNFLLPNVFSGRIPHFQLLEDDAGICKMAVTKHGYKCQEFNVRTDDGYILSMQRIPEGKQVANGSVTMTRPPVLLQHGIFVDGMTWLMDSPEQSLGMVLADSGFDVWISNTRGTQFSRRHLTLDSAAPEYWDWTWDDLVVHEFPAVIDFVFNQTRQKIHFVGHSMGTSVALAAFSQGRKVDKVKSATMLCPVAYLTHVTASLLSISQRFYFGEILDIFGVHELNPRGIMPIKLFQLFCGQPGVNCYNILDAITGANCCITDTTMDLFLKHGPQPTSTKNLVHMAQTTRDRTLRKYDYVDPRLNKAKYGELTPPLYHLENIPRDFPMLLSYGGRDTLADVLDVQTLLDLLKNHDVGKLDVKYIQEYGHADYFLAANAKHVIYDHIISFLRTHN